MTKKYDVTKLQDGWHTDDNGEEFFFISNPALGLWAVHSRFQTENEQAQITKKPRIEK
jgi:hypothetical protein